MSSKTVGENIRMLRESVQFTESNLARFLGVDQSLISKVEKGERTLSADMLEKLAALLGVTVGQIEGQSITTSKLSFAFMGRDFNVEEMEAMAAINKIAQNSELMRILLKEERA